MSKLNKKIVQVSILAAAGVGSLIFSIIGLVLRSQCGSDMCGGVLTFVCNSLMHDLMLMIVVLLLGVCLVALSVMLMFGKQKKENIKGKNKNTKE